MSVSDESSKKFQKELNSGTVGLILLAIIEQSKEPLYGYQIVKNLEQHAENLPMMKQGALYPVLRSMETSGLLTSRVEPSVSGPPRKYYEITPAGRQNLESWKKIWKDTSRIVNSVLSGGDNASH
ncbi:PadR family transcriptional regulator [Myxococcota bacterium]|nr:PadR family transcriptional regulator [Myxococcota bacterium]MBU1379894.1 PadR family transcriptional regulator [Myxococcota bacterium]MBU1496360.1 PadR family transcriptional regulator [Myxococcota bacterium]